MSTVAEPTTVKTYLRPIDRDGLMKFAEAGRANPGKRGTNKVHTVTEGQYRTLSYVGQHAPVVGSSRVDLQACKLEYSIVSPK